MKRIFLFLCITIQFQLLIAQTASDNFSSLNYRESVFTEDLKYVFVFRKENLGNVFIYDVVNNTMVKELRSENGVILKVVPSIEYFLVITTNALEVYDIHTFGKYYELPFGYKPIEKLVVKPVSSPVSEDPSYIKSLPEWMKISVNVSQELLSCKWDDGQLMIWNWKTRKSLYKKTLTKSKYGTVLGDVRFGTVPQRIMIHDGQQVSIYDSTFRELATATYPFDYFFSMYNDVNNEIMIFSSSYNLSSGQLTSTMDVYKEDLKTKTNTIVRNYNFKDELIRTPLGTFGKFLITEEYRRETSVENEYKNLNHNLRKLIIQDAASGRELYVLQGAFGAVSPDASRVIVKRIKGEMPVYHIEKYTSFFKKKSSNLSGNRYYYKYKKEVESITYQQVIDLNTGKEIVNIPTADPLYYYRDLYILQNSFENGGLKLFDFNTGQLIKEI